MEHVAEFHMPGRKLTATRFEGFTNVHYEGGGRVSGVRIGDSVLALMFFQEIVRRICAGDGSLEICKLIARYNETGESYITPY